MGGGQEEHEPCRGQLYSKTTLREMEPELQGERARKQQWVHWRRDN